MSNAPQCPSTIGEKNGAKPRAPVALTNASGRALWRGLDEIADTPEFRDHLEREFPAFASEWRGSSRRDFMRVMAASMALAGVAATVPGCRRPDHRIMPYTRDPEDVIHGKPLFYATAMPLPGGGAEGLLVETHEGRPTKIEGNPLHPMNQGRSSVHSQASVLDLYDPDRLTGVWRATDGRRSRSTWAEFDAFASAHFARFDRTKGAGLAFLVDKSTSPSREAMRRRMTERWPESKWLPYEAIDNESALEGSKIALGAPHAEVLSVAKAKVIVAIEREFVGCFAEHGSIPDARGFAAGRRVTKTAGEGSAMNRLYAVESTMSLTGGMADHRLRLRPSQAREYFAALGAAIARRTGAGELGAAVGETGGVAAALGVEPAWIEAVADDLVAHKGESLVLVGPSMPAAAHALAIALNAALGNVGKTVHYAPLSGDAAASSLESIKTLAGAMTSLDTLVIIGANPVHTAPADLNFAAGLAKAKTTIHVGLHEDETAAACSWRLPLAHYLESWGDVDAVDGSRSVIQPMIAPLAYETAGIEGARTDLEILAVIMADEKRDPYEIVRRTWREALGQQEEEFEKTWRRALHDGVLAGTPGSAPKRASGRVLTGAVAAAASGLRSGGGVASGLEVVFTPSRTLWDGRWANNGWLQELPDGVSKVTWDNPALISPATAARMGVADGGMITLSVSGRKIDLPVWRAPGMADDTIALELGYGRTSGGRILGGVGFDTFAVRTSGAMRVAAGASATVQAATHRIACVQTHWAMEGRPIILEADLPAWLAHGDETIPTHDAYGRPKTLNFAMRLPPSDESHTPANRDVYEADQQHLYEKSPQWGMSIDLTTCVGCGACTTACQAENNIPVVGKSEVLKGREMHWIRVDRYYATTGPGVEHGLSGDFGASGSYSGGRGLGDADMLVMPVPCMHCENAPCETVCPVNATVHGEEGLNEMAYNRCIGTRYCSNNCPYKVRRFNFFDYATKRLNGDYIGKGLLGGVIPSEQLVPPRLREKIDKGVGEAQTMQFNPDVTVRERGVMEKCTYCVQRINESRVEVKLKGFDHIPDGFFETACQQACPTDSIVFGDIADPLSRVRAMRDHGRTYSLLSYVNTRPRTTYMARLRNPNTALRDAVVDPFGHGHGHDAHDGGHAPAHGGEEKGHVMSLPVLPSRRSFAAKAIGSALSAGGLA